MNDFARKVPRARWLYILPVCFFVNVFAFMDRQVISMALPGGMMKDLAMNATLAGFAAGITAIGYLFLQVQAGQLAQKGKVKTFIAISIIAWSIFSILTGFVQNSWQLFAVRFLLGVAEGGFGPAIVTLITFWFPDKDGERNRAYSFYYSGNSFAMMIMGPIAGTIIAASDWRILFVVLGGISLLTAGFWMVFIKERPEDAKWLSIEEREYIVTTIHAEQEVVKKGTDIKLTGNKISLTTLFKNKYVWLLCIIGFCVNMGQFGFGMWMPTMIKTITKAGILGVGWLTVLPNIAVLIGLWTWSFITLKVRDRRLTTGIPPLLFGIILTIGTFVIGNPIIGIAMICLAAFFIQAHMPSFSTIPSLLLVKELDGPTRGLIGVASGLGAFAGPYIVGYFISLVGSTNAGMYFLAGTLVFGFFTSLLLPKNVGVANAYLDKQHNLSAELSK
jgi:sugar phosphate permease